MRTLEWASSKVLLSSLVIAMTGCGELGKAVDKLEEMDKEIAGENDTPPAPPTTTTPTEPAAPVVPEPAAPTPSPAPAPVEVAKPEPAPDPKPTPTTAKPRPEPAKTVTTKTDSAKTQATKPEPASAKPEPIKTEPPKPAPVTSAPVKPEPAPAKAKTSIPQSKHVRIEAPKRVQELLDLDGRMQPWLNNTMKVIEQCYADVLQDDPKAAGTIAFVLEMHASSRPDADIAALPPALTGIVTCATGKLMRAARMPLFTGNEGEKHTVRVKFTP